VIPAVYAVVAGAIALALPQDAQQDLVLRERELGVMGTSLQIRAIGEDEKALDMAIDAAVREMQRVEDVMTDWRASELTELNDSAGDGPHAVPKELARLIARALDVGKLTAGAFDVTYAGAGKLWDFKATPPVIPTEEALRAALASVDYRRVVVDLEADTVDLPAGMRIGLGGIAKGYGVDRAMKVLMDSGVEHALVNAGGDLKALGRRFGEPWEIAIRHPRDRDHVIAALPVSNSCVVTSGDYERFFEHEGKRYHHILDPRTGYPSEGCMSATVVAPDAAFADALATAFCVIGPERSLELVEGLERVEAILVDLEGRVTVSSGLQGR
jgi:thiamine biosynthesis lipoprotein